MVEYEYDAWGNHILKGSNRSLGKYNPFRYRGYYYDAETELYYLQTRYYDPELGRFITIDGIDYADPETINGLNLYAYCGNNPIMFTDANGNDWNSFFNSVGKWFKRAGKAIKDFFVDDVYGGIIKPTFDWVTGVAVPITIFS